MTGNLNDKEIIINVALLDTFKKKGDFDYIDCFLPTVSHVLKTYDASKIEVYKVRDLLTKEMGIQFPEASISSVLKRAVKRNILEKSEGYFLKNSDVLDEYANKYQENKKQIENDQVKVASDFITFTKKEFDTEVTADKFFDIFYHFLKNNLLDILGPSYEPNIEGKSPNNDNFLISSFLKNQWSKESGFPASIERNIKGFLLSNYLSTASYGLSEKIKNFKVYVDTPLIIAALGYNGRSKEIYSKELFDSLVESGASLYVLDVNEEELRGIIKGWIHDFKTKNFQNFKVHTLSLLLNKGYDEVVLERHLTLLDTSLKDLGLKKIEKPDYIDGIQIGDEELKSKLVKAGFDPDRPSTDRDVECISCINRFRKGGKTYSNSDEIHIFLSKNPALRRVANDYFYEENLACDDSIPPLMGEGVVASMLLAHHSGRFNELGRRLLLSQAYSFIFTDDRFVEQYSKRLDSLLKEKGISEEDYVLYRYDHEIRSFIKHYKVSNDIEDCDEDEFLDLLEKIKEREKKRDRAAREEMEKRVKSIKDSLKREEDRNRNLRIAKEEASEKSNNLVNENEGLVEANIRLEKVVSYIVVALVVIFIGIFLYFGEFYIDKLKEGNLKTIAKVINVVVNILLLYLGTSGTGLKGYILNKIKNDS